MAGLEGRSLDLMMDWLYSGQAVEGDRELLIELVERIEGDNWRNRWYVEADPINDVLICQPRPGLHLLLREEPDHGGEWKVTLINIYDDGVDHQHDPG